MMRLMLNSRREAKAVCGLLVATVLPGLVLPASVQAQANPPQRTAQEPQKLSPEEVQKRDDWRKKLMATPRPKNGCFTANYPEGGWHEVPCKPSQPHKLYLPQHGGMTKIDTVGGTGPDFSATVTGQITEVEGSFDSVTGVTSNNAYTLQVNTAPFTTSTCSGSPNPGACSGWEQFVYESSGGGFIQYWLLTYGPAGTMCPTPRHNNCQAGLSYSDGWCPFQFSASGPVYCVVNGASEAPAPATAQSSLGQLRVTGTAAGGGSNDAITVTVGATPYSATGNNYFPDLGTQWQEAEFNVFGDGNSSQVAFNSGSTVVVRTAVTSGTRNGPGCHIKSWTGESSNLTLSNMAPTASSGAAPALVFSQSNPPPSGATATCADALSLGDTHLTTFGRLLYDFQAAGDFVLAETASNFVVQTRQVSGAPQWPNATVNKAIAVQTRKSRVAICTAPARVMIDGKPATLQDGKVVALPDGGIVVRKGNAYIVRGPDGDSVRAAVNTDYIDVSVGLGRWPTKVRGLLANAANGKVDELEARDGTILASPFSFEKFYGHYGESWRVRGNESMLSACGEVKDRSRPKAPFYTKDLDPKLAREKRAICARAGVKEGALLEACTLDLAFFGHDTAAKPYIGMAPPKAVGTIQLP